MAATNVILGQSGGDFACDTGECTATIVPNGGFISNIGPVGSAAGYVNF